MNAIRVHQFGGVDALVYEDVDPPVPEDGQVLRRRAPAERDCAAHAMPAGRPHKRGKSVLRM
jgi:hypothetical protein